MTKDNSIDKAVDRAADIAEKKREKEKVEKLPVEVHLRGRVSLLQQQLEGVKEQLGFQQEFTNDLRTAIDAIEPIEFSKEVSQGAKSHSSIAAVVKYSDWHIGEQTSADETEGFGSYNWAVAQERIGTIAAKEIEWIQTMRHSYKIPELDIMVEGDLVSGDIHEELRVTNEFPLPVQVANAGYLLANIVARFAPYFDVVKLVETGGDNHGRLVKKPQAKQKAQNNMMFAVYAVANAFLRDHKNVRIVQPAGVQHIHDIAGWKFLSKHGDDTKAWMGIPWYGIQRAKGREAIKRMQRMLREMKNDVGFDYISIGHWHVPNILEDTVFVNGSLSGTSEYDHIAGRHAPPSQVSFLVHPKYGYFNYTAWKTKIL